MTSRRRWTVIGLLWSLDLVLFPQPSPAAQAALAPRAPRIVQSGESLALTGNLELLALGGPGEPASSDLDPAPGPDGIRWVPVLDNIEQPLQQRLPPALRGGAPLAPASGPGGLVVPLRRIRVVPGRLNLDLAALARLMNRKTRIALTGKVFVPGSYRKYGPQPRPWPPRVYLALSVDSMMLRDLPVPADLPTRRERLEALACRWVRDRFAIDHGPAGAPGPGPGDLSATVGSDLVVVVTLRRPDAAPVEYRFDPLIELGTRPEVGGAGPAR